MNAQEPGTLGSRDPLWEDESPLHWALKINKLETRKNWNTGGGGQSVWWLVEDWCAVYSSETQHRCRSLKVLVARKVYQKGWGF